MNCNFAVAANRREGSQLESAYLRRGESGQMFAYTFALLERVKVDRKGVTAMEYGVIAAGIVLVVATAAVSLGSKVSTLFGSIGAKL